MATENPPTPIPALTPELVASLQERTHDVLSYLVQTNSISTYFKEAEKLADFRNALEQRGAADSIYQTFHESVPFSVYKDYFPYVSRFSEQPCKKDSVVNLMAPGLPYFLAHSSGTSSGVAKHFPKYQHPKHMSMSTIEAMQASNPTSKHGGKNCIVYSLRALKVVDCVDDDGTVEQRIPICLMSGGTIRMNNDMAIERDEFYQTLKVPNNSSPLGVSYISDFRTFLFMHALFALQEPQVELINTMFSNNFRDFALTIHDRWDELVDCVESGKIPDMEGMDHVRDKIAKYLPPSPERAAELRRIGRAVDSPGWFTKIWPGLRVIVAVTSGPFQMLVPEIRHYIGPDVELRTLGINCSEAFFANAYDDSDSELYKVVGSDEIIEFLPVDAPEEPKYLAPTWQVEKGGQYEVILTTRDGLWRYRLEDIIEVVGFDPRDGQPVIHYLRRRSGHIRLSTELIHEGELRDALKTTTESFGVVSEFCVSADYRTSTPRYNFFVEPQGALGPDPASAAQQIHAYLQQIHENYRRDAVVGKVGVPAIRVLKQGTFTEYREWKVRTTKMASGQIKVPCIVHDETLINWLSEREIEEY